MAAKGISEFRADGENYTVNDPNIANEFDATVSYAVGTYVNYQGDLWRFVSAHAAGAWNGQDVIKIKIGDEISGLKDADDENIAGSIKEWDIVLLKDVTIGKTISSSGLYQDAAYGYENLRAATPSYYMSGNYVKIVPLTGYKVGIAFYDESKTFVNYYGWITSETIYRSAGKYFRILVGGDSSIESVYKTIASVYSQYSLYDVNRRVDDLNEMYGGEVILPAWIDGKFPNWTTDAIWDGAGYKYARRVRVVPGASYIYTGEMNSVCGIVFYDESNTVISGAGTNSNEFTAPANAYYANIGTKGTSTNPHLYFSAKAVETSNTKAREIEANEISGAIDTSLVANPEVGAHLDLQVSEGERYLITGYCYIINTYPIVIYLNNSTVISYDNLVSAAGGVSDRLVVVPSGANRMLVNGKPSQIKVKMEIASVKDAITDIYSQVGNLNNLEGKTIVWFGMSIPANGWFGNEHPNAYPQKVGRLLGANVINEAIGSSCIHCKDPARITEANPYGFNTNFEASSRCLTNTQTEMDWICENWDSDIWTLNKPSEMTDWLSGVIHGFGYEEKIDKYLTAQTFPDLFVFDHGFNDPSDPNNYYETYGRYSLYTFRGGMNFLIKRILDYNPYANIIIIGNYTTTRDVPQMQTAVAEDWAIPICKQWENLGLSLTENVTANGYWSETGGVYEWVEDSTARSYSVRDRLVPDHVHPHSNPTGKVVNKMAGYIAKWMLANLPMYN